MPLMPDQPKAMMFDGFSALANSLYYLKWHILFALAATVLMTLLRTASQISKNGVKAGIRASPETLVVLLAFSTFGFVTAYFLTRTINADTGAPDSDLIKTFSAPFIALLAGAITYLSSRQEHPTRYLFSGLGCFLMCSVISYQTFVFQKTTLPDMRAAEAPG